MPKIAISDNVRIASQEAKRQEIVDLLAPGKGIPWEDRGSSGSLSAFVRTALPILGHPVEVLNRIRRPESKSEAAAFARVCAAIWFVAVIIQSAFDYFFVLDKSQINANQYMINTALQALVVGIGAMLVPMVAGAVYYKLAAHDMTTKVPPMLIRNTMAYLMAPSLIALIPGSVSGIWIAPAIAIAWIVAYWIIAGTGRLRISTGGAIVSSILSFVICTLIAVAIYVAAISIWIKGMNNQSAVVVVHDPTHLSGQP